MRIRLLIFVFATLAVAVGAQQAAPVRLPAPEPATAVYPLDTALLQWPLPPDGQAYADIDGRHLHAYVVDRPRSPVGIAIRATRSSGGVSPAPRATLNRLTGWPRHFRRIGLTDVRVQPLDLPPQWMPQSWRITATARCRDAGARSLRAAGVRHSRHERRGPRRRRGLGRHRQRRGFRRPLTCAAKPSSCSACRCPGIDEQHLDARGRPQARGIANAAAAVFEVMALPGNPRDALVSPA